MQGRYQQIYERLQDGLKQILKQPGAERERMLACVKCAEAHWLWIQGEVAKRGFATEQEEISFFKTIKPRFTAEIEYYRMRYVAEPSVREIRKFYADNADFVIYLKERREDQDRKYFLRQAGEGLESAGDGLVARKMAYDRINLKIKS